MLELFLSILSEPVRISIILVLQKRKTRAERGDVSQNVQTWDLSLAGAESAAHSCTTFQVRNQMLSPGIRPQPGRAQILCRKKKPLCGVLRRLGKISESDLAQSCPRKIISLRAVI